MELVEPLRGMHGLCLEICPGMWSITPYARCDFRCHYCCTSVQGRSVPVEGVHGSRDIRGALAVVPTDDLVILGAFSDAYPSVESTIGLTRRVLEAIIDEGRRFTVVTKGDTVLRDVDLLQAAGDAALVQVSICATDDGVLKQLDPGAPSGTRRFEMIAALHEAGVPVELNALPWIPGVTDTARLLHRLPDGVRATFSPLATGGDQMRLLGRVFRRSDVWAAYLEEYQRYGHLERASWVRPSLPPNENHPLIRLAPLASPPVCVGTP